MDVRLLFLFSYWKEGFTSVIFLPLYFSFKFSIRSLPSFEDLPFSAPTLGPNIQGALGLCKEATNSKTPIHLVPDTVRDAEDKK